MDFFGMAHNLVPIVLIHRPFAYQLRILRHEIQRIGKGNFFIASPHEIQKFRKPKIHGAAGKYNEMPEARLIKPIDELEDTLLQDSFIAPMLP